MATLSVQNIDLTGLKPTYANATALGDEFVNTTGRVFLHVKNGDATDKTVTIASQKTCDQGETHNIAVAIPASEERLIGPLTTGRFNDGDGKVQVTYSAVTSVTVAAIQIP